MILNILHVAIGFIGLFFCLWVYLDYFGWIKYGKERNKRRKVINSKHGRMMLICVVIANIAALILLYFNLPVLISMWSEGWGCISEDMIWSFIKILVAMIGMYYCSGAFVYYFGWHAYDGEKEERRKYVISKYGVTILICAILIDIAALYLLYINLLVLMGRS